MPYGETKVYSDGSHYIAIPHTTRPYRKRRKIIEEEITIQEDNEEKIQETGVSDEITDTPISAIENRENIEKEIGIKANQKKMKEQKQLTKKALFENLYSKYIDLPKNKRRSKIIEEMRSYFKNEERAEHYVDANMARKKKNLIYRRIRLTRKANLQEFNYFCTFTYDGNKNTEQSFKKKLINTLSHFSSRKGWKYIGVWERSPEKKRLHFHGIFYIPDGTMPGTLEEKKDYNFKTHDRKVTVQNTYFNERFGRTDFEKIEDVNRLGDAMAYLMKYLEKSGEKIVYSRRLPQFFISDVMDEDIVTTIGLEDKKLLLYDDFKCWDEGEYIGPVSKETIAKLRKSN